MHAVSRGRALSYALLPLVLIAAFVLAYFTFRTTFQLDKLRQQSVLESTLALANEKADRLDKRIVTEVVQQRSAGVKRTCWERGGGTEANVNVRVHLVIAGTGNVQTASAEGNDPIVSKCIENSVQHWQFPVSSGSTTVDIPFHFLRQ
jgi:hypothetical protein